MHDKPHTIEEPLNESVFTPREALIAQKPAKIQPD